MKTALLTCILLAGCCGTSKTTCSPSGDAVCWSQNFDSGRRLTEYTIPEARFER